MKSILYSLFIVISSITFAITPEERGLRIAWEWKNRDTGWGDYSAKTKLILKNSHGEVSERYFTYSTIEVLEEGKKIDGDKVLVIFDKPQDVKGTTLLTYSHFTRDDDQWLYLPAIRRTKRISSHNKSGSFMGSEITYEDITFQEVQRYKYRWVKEDSINGELCDVVDRFPIDTENSGYSFHRVWYDRSHVRIHKIEYYDRKGSLLKTQSFKNYKKYLEKYWRSDEEEFINHQTGKSTVLIWEDYQFHVGLTKKQFNKNTLDRYR